MREDDETQNSSVYKTHAWQLKHLILLQTKTHFVFDNKHACFNMKHAHGKPEHEQTGV